MLDRDGRGLGVPSVSPWKVTDFLDADELCLSKCVGTGMGGIRDIVKD